MAAVPPFVARTQLKLTLHYLYDTIAAHSMHESHMLEMLEEVVGLHNERFKQGSFDGERNLSGRARKQLEAQNWQPQPLAGPCLLTNLIATPEEQLRVMDHLLQYAQQPSALEPKACVRAAALLCHYTAQNADTLAPTAWTAAPLLDRALELAKTCANLLSHVPEAGQLEADDLFAGAALVLGNPRLEAGPARVQWECIGDLLREGFEKQAYRVENDMLLQLIKAHVRVARLGEVAARALIQLYLQESECRPAIMKVLEALASRDSEQAKAALKECLEADRHDLRDQQAQALKEKLRGLGFDFDWRDMSGESVDDAEFKLFLKPGSGYVKERHRQLLEVLASATPHPEECWRLLAFLASHHPDIERFTSRTGSLVFRVTYGSQLTISCSTDEHVIHLEHLERFLARHFSLKRGSAIVLEGVLEATVLKVDATQANAYEVGQCIHFLLGVLKVLREMRGEWLLGDAFARSSRFRFLPSLTDAAAWLNPQGIVRLLLRMEDESREQVRSLDDFFLKNFEWLPCDRADRVLELATGFSNLTAPERLQLTERIIAALLAAGLTGRAQDAAKRFLDEFAQKIDLVALSQQSIAALPLWQLRARSLLLRTAWERLGPTGSHVESFGKAFSAMAFSAATDEAVHDYLDWVQSFAKPAELLQLLKALPAPLTWGISQRQRELQWTHFDELSWRSVTWSLAPFGRHDEQKHLSLNGKPVLFRMPFHSALVAKFGGPLTEVEVINLCIVNSRHLEPAEVPRVAAAVRNFLDGLLSTRRSEPGLPRPVELLSEDILRDLLNEISVPADAREKFEQMLAEFQKLTGSPHEDLLRGLPHLIPLFFQANTREALEWTLAMARLLADRYPDVAAKLLNQVPFDAREGQPEWESLSLRVQGLAPKRPAAAGLPVPLVKDVLVPTDSFQIPRIFVGLWVDSLGRIGPIDASAPSSVECGNLLRKYVDQMLETEPSSMVWNGGEPITLAEKCLQDFETAVGLLQQVQCREPLSLIRGIVQSKGAPILQLIGSGRVGCRVNPRDAPDFCGVRARWQLPLDLNVHEADCVYASATGLVRSSEPAGMSLLQALVCQESLEALQRSRIIDGMFELWDGMSKAAPSGTDGAWAGMLLVLEHRGLLTGAMRLRANGVRATLLQRWRAGSDMPGLSAMALIRPHRDTFESSQEIVPILEPLFRRSRGQPDEDRIATWVMRRLHHLDGKEVRDAESRFRSEGAAPLFDDAKKILEEQLRTLGVVDPVNDDLDLAEYAKKNHLVSLWAGCANSSADASKALLRIKHYKSPSSILAPAFGRLAWALPGEDPDWPRLAKKWARHSSEASPFHADIARALLGKFAQERLPSFWHEEWQTAGKLAIFATRATAATAAQPELAQYLAKALENALKQGSRYVDELTSRDVNEFDHVEIAIQLCEMSKSRCPAWYDILLPVTKAAAQHVIDRDETPEKKVEHQTYYLTVFAKLEQRS